MQQFDVLQRNTEIVGRKFLEASAGTGKTFAIEHIVARLILEKGMCINQILVMTFTRAATRELKMRIRTTLEMALEQVKQNAARWDYLQEILDAGKRDEALRALEDALSLFDEAQIFTIHGFCHHLLCEFAFEAKVSFSLQEPEDEEEKIWNQKQFILDFFRTGLTFPDYSPAQIDAVLKKNQYDYDRLARRLSVFLERPLNYASLSTFEESYTQFNELLKKTPLIHSERALEDFRKIVPHYKRINLLQAENQYAKLLKLIEKKTASIEEYDALISHQEWVLELLQEKNLKKRAVLPKKEELNDPELIPLLYELLADHLKNAHDPAKTFMRMARDSQKNFLKKSCSFDELLRKVEENLQNEAFCTQARERFRALIVDEFQDTDPLQWKIFQEIFLSPSSKLSTIYLVGDPKQSIYRFRGADVYTYLKAQNALTEKAHLSTNFRSTSSLIAALNLLFSTQRLHLPLQGDSLSYYPVQAKDQDLANRIPDGKGSAHFFLSCADQGREKSWPTAKTEKEAFFPFIAQEIQRLYDCQKMHLKDFAVLVKDWAQASRLQDFLKSYGIASSCSRGKNLSETLAFSALKELIEALQDSSKEKIVLAGPFFNLTLEDLKETDPGQVHELFLKLRQKWEEKPYFSLFFSEFLTISWNGKTVLKQILLREDFYAEVHEVVENLSHAPWNSLDTLLLGLKELQNLNKELKTRSFQDEVTIQTIHASKGLEFEIVFALGVASRHPYQDELIVVRHEEGEKLEKLNENEKESILYLQEQDAEKMRQFYVALTRAKKRVYIPVALENEISSIEFGKSASIELFFSQAASGLAKEEVVGLLEMFTKQADISYEVLQGPFSLRVLEREVPLALDGPEVASIPVRPKALLSFSSLASKTHSLHQKNQESLHDLPRGAETGILLHKILELIFKNGLFLQERCDERQKFVQTFVQKTELKEWNDLICQMIEDCLSATLSCPDEEFCLLDLNPNKILQELEFLFPLQENFIKGFADLIFEKNGKYYLVDWKSNWLEAYTHENLEKTMQSQDYFLQAAIYASAFERFVKLFDNRAFSDLFGGAFYIFLRGPAVYYFMPERTKVLC